MAVRRVISSSETIKTDWNCIAASYMTLIVAERDLLAIAYFFC